MINVYIRKTNIVKNLKRKLGRHRASSTALFRCTHLEANVYVAQSPDLEGLVLEGQTLEEIKNEALSCSKILLEIALNKSAPETQTDFIWHTVQQASA